jgi:hypothetical protein
MRMQAIGSSMAATLGAALALASAPAMAGKPGSVTGTYNPEIAYTSNQGSAWSVYLANADGTNPVAVYSRRSGSVGKVDFVPGSGPTGGQLVFQPTLGSISVLKYTASTSGITVNSIVSLVTEQSLLISSVDVSPDGLYILYKVSIGDNLSTLTVIPIGGGPVSIVSTGYYAEAVWSRDVNPRRIAVSIGFSANTGGLPRIETFTLNNDFSYFDTSDPIYGPCADCTSIAIEFARTQDNVLFGVAGGTSSGMYDVPYLGGALASYGAGGTPCFNANDTKLYYKNGSSVLYALDVVTNLSKKVSTGSVNAFDVRP